MMMTPFFSFYTTLCWSYQWWHEWSLKRAQPMLIKADNISPRPDNRITFNHICWLRFDLVVVCVLTHLGISVCQRPPIVFHKTVFHDLYFLTPSNHFCLSGSVLFFRIQWERLVFSDWLSHSQSQFCLRYAEVWIWFWDFYFVARLGSKKSSAQKIAV